MIRGYRIDRKPGGREVRVFGDLVMRSVRVRVRRKNITKRQQCRKLAQQILQHQQTAAASDIGSAKFSSDKQRQERRKLTLQNFAAPTNGSSAKKRQQRRKLAQQN